MFLDAIARSGLPMLLTDARLPDNPVIFANAACCAMTGYAEARFVGSNCRFMQGPGTDRTTVARLRDAVRDRREVAVELLNYRADGTAFWNALFVSPVFAPDGELLHFFASILDVTPRRETERRLSTTRGLDSLGALAGGVAHEFNNLLTIIRGNIEPLIAAVDDVRHARRFTRIADAVERATQLTQSMVSFARRQYHRQQILDLAEVIRQGLPRLADELGPEIRLTIDMPGEPVLVFVDLDQLRVSLVNVLANAREATRGRGHVAIVLRLRHGGVAGTREAVLDVRDDGPGISPQVAARAAEPFYTTKPPGAGAGLGVSVADGFTRQSGGYMELSGRPGGGTQARLVLPAYADAMDILPRARSGETVLLVDGDGAHRQHASTLLESLGYAVHHAIGPDESMECMRSASRIDLMICDVRLSAIPGPVLAQLARAVRPRLAVLFADADAVGRADRLAKPFDRPLLARRVRDALSAPVTA